MHAGTAADPGGRRPKRLIADDHLRTRVELAHHHHIPLSELNSWDPDDLGNALGLVHLEAQSCSQCGVHESVWKPELGGRRQAVVAEWKYCEPCDLRAQAQEAGPPNGDKGYHVVLRYR